jgi:hypothetical protein
MHPTLSFQAPCCSKSPDTSLVIPSLPSLSPASWSCLCLSPFQCRRLTPLIGRGREATQTSPLCSSGVLKLRIHRQKRHDDCPPSPFFISHLLPSATNLYPPCPDLLIFHPLPPYISLSVPSSCYLLAVLTGRLLSSFSRVALLEPAASSLLEAT